MTPRQRRVAHCSHAALLPGMPCCAVPCVSAVGHSHSGKKRVLSFEMHLENRYVGCAFWDALAWWLCGCSHGGAGKGWAGGGGGGGAWDVGMGWAGIGYDDR